MRFNHGRIIIWDNVCDRITSMNGLEVGVCVYLLLSTYKIEYSGDICGIMTQLARFLYIYCMMCHSHISNKQTNKQLKKETQPEQ